MRSALSEAEVQYCPANESEEDFWLTKYYLYYRIIEHGGSSDHFNLSFRLSTECPGEDAAPEGPAKDTIICTHDFQIAPFNSNYKPLLRLFSVEF